MSKSMAFDPQNNWVLFPNKKGDNPKRPDYRGTVKIDGKEFELAGWKRTSEDGKVRLSGTVKPREAKKPDPAPASEFPPGSKADQDEDVPF